MLPTLQPWGLAILYLADEIFAYDPLNYLVFSVAMPVAGRIIDATPDDPNLSVRINIDPAQLTALIAEAGPMGVPTRPTSRGMYVDRIDNQLLDAVLRLARLLDTPKVANWILIFHCMQ